MGLLHPIIRILGRVVDCLRDHFPACNAITTQFIGHNLPRLIIVVSYEPSEEALGGRTISERLKVNIHYVTILVNGAPQVVLLASDLDEDLIDVERVAIALVLSL
jgi:hypothetical protein